MVYIKRRESKKNYLRMNEVCSITSILFFPPGFFAYRSFCLHAFWFFIIWRLDKNHEYPYRIDCELNIFGKEHFNSNNIVLILQTLKINIDWSSLSSYSYLLTFKFYFAHKQHINRFNIILFNLTWPAMK